MRFVLKISVILIFLWTNIIYSQQYWLKYGNATTQNLWKCSFVDTLNGWAVGDSGTIVYTSNGGLNWITQNSKLRDYMISVHFINKRLGWAIAWGLDTNYFGSYILKTTNGGMNWDTSRYPIPDTYIRTIFFLDSLTGYMGGGPAILLKTTNAGLSWFSCETDTTTVISKFPIGRFRFYNNNFGIACGGIMDMAGVIWKTTNAGLYWSSTAISPDPITDIKIYDTLTYLAIGGDFEYGASILKTTDGGLNWTYKNMGLMGILATISFRTDSEAWCPLGYIPNFFKTSDNGNTWELIDTPDSLQIFDLVFINNKFGIGVGLNGSIVRFNYGSININNNTNFAYSSKLYQNYPNPFNPYTNIEFTLSGISEIELKIYNILGKEVATLYKGIKSEGRHNFKFNGNTFPSGLYFYKLVTRNLKTGIINIETKKMILLK